MNKIIEEYIAIVDFLSHIIGNNIEIVLHDLLSTDGDSSIVAIVNGHVSGRSKESTLTSAGLMFIKNEVYKTNGSLIGYRGLSESGEDLVCYTKFIKDEEENLIGMLCINCNHSMQKQALFNLASVLNIDLDSSNELVIEERETKQKVNILEKFSKSLKETIENELDSILKDENLPKERLTAEEKIMVVLKLEEKGIFLVKGAVYEVAHLLGISEASVYRYLAKKE